jgi:integrase
VTNPPTSDPAEAKRQLLERMGEQAHVREQRARVADLRVMDLLGLYVAECRDTGVRLQAGRVEPWIAALGRHRAIEVRRDMLDTICRRWRQVGPSWDDGQLDVPGYEPVKWAARDPKRVRPLSGASLNRYVAVLRRAFRLGHEKRGLLTPLTFPHFSETARGEYLTEDRCRAICANFQARKGAPVKADVIRFAYLTGVRSGQLRRTEKCNVLIDGPTWKLRWDGSQTKNGRSHEIVLVGEALEIVQRAWDARRLDSPFLFHIDGRPIGELHSELRRTCKLLGIPYGRSKGIVFHDTRHSAVTNLVAAGVPEPTAMSITGHVTSSVFQRYNVRRDDVQRDALEVMQQYLAARRGSDPCATPAIAKTAK